MHGISGPNNQAKAGKVKAYRCGHVGRLTSNGACPECRAKYDAAYYETNKTKITSRAIQWNLDNKDKRKEICQRSYEKNKAKILQKAKEKRQAEPAKELAKCRARQTSQIQRMPKWADKKAIEAFYELARQKTKETGIPHHVDHVIPLRGKSVSGFHVESNLRVITSAENLSKGAKLPDTMAP